MLSHELTCHTDSRQVRLPCVAVEVLVREQQICMSQEVVGLDVFSNFTFLFYTSTDKSHKRLLIERLWCFVFVFIVKKTRGGIKRQKRGMML